MKQSYSLQRVSHYFVTLLLIVGGVGSFCPLTARGDGPAAPEGQKLTAAERKMEDAERRLKIARRDFEKNTAAYEESQAQVKEVTARTEGLVRQMGALDGKETAAEKAGLQEILQEEKRKLIAVKAEAKAAKRSLEVVTRLLKSAENRFAAAEKKYGSNRALASAPDVVPPSQSAAR